MDKKVSIIVPVYKARIYLEECLESLLNQTYPHCEVVVIYVKGDKKAGKIIAKFQGYPSLLPVKIKKNEGISSTRNLGIKISSGDYVAFCDDDDFFYPEKIEKQIKVLEEPGVGLTYCDFQVVNTKSELLTEASVPEWDFDKWLKDTYIGLSTIMVEKEILEKAGLFNEELFASEDFELLLRLSTLTTFKKTNGFLASRRIHSSNHSRKTFKILLGRYKIYKKYGYSALGLYTLFRNLFVSNAIFYLYEHPRLYETLKKIKR
ncbi:MAG: glycosyltransferase [Euryarchaeota archaeon]|nr:glycosyltransferase [Euryarchaeota archaeon]